MEEKQVIENIIRNIAQSFTGEQSTRDWTAETIWFDASPYACVGAKKASKVFDDAFGSLASCNVTILDMRTRINGNAALVCSGAEMGNHDERRQCEPSLHDASNQPS